MSLLRRMPTTHLLALCGAVVALAVGGAAIASALSGGPLPPRRPLAVAVHKALLAGAPTGISARISFTNTLVDSSSFSGSDPLITGGSGRLYFDPTGHRVRLTLDTNRGESQLMIGNGTFWYYDQNANTLYKGNLPQSGAKDSAAQEKAGKAKADASHKVPSIANIKSAIAKLAQNVLVRGPLRGTVAHQGAYTVSFAPRHDGGLLGRAELAWDALRGVPLRVAVYARGRSAPVLELKASDIAYGALPSDAFSGAAPSDAKVVNVQVPTGQQPSGAKGRRVGHQRSVTGVAAVRAAVHFSLHAPRQLVGLPRQQVRLMRVNSTPSALVVYGKGLGAIAVLERSAAAEKSHKAATPAHGASSATSGASGPSQSDGHDHQGFSLPTISIKGASGKELATALGTLLTFSRGGVDYTVVGSVPANAAEAAARGL